MKGVKAMGAIDVYIKTYCDMNFERRGLFEIISQRFPAEKVIYPGCSTHITPSFFFQDVLYIDSSQAAKDFFMNHEEIDKLIAENKMYQQSPYFDFSAEDFLKNQKNVNYKYDILISLYADDVLESCMIYLKSGGVAISNNFHNEVISILKSGSFELIGSIVGKNDYYKYTTGSDIKIYYRDEEKIQKMCMKYVNDSIRYVDNEIYYVLRKL